MPHDLDHLHTGVWSFLDEPEFERIRRLYLPKWVSYARGNEALARMEHLLRYPPSGRMPCMLLYGDSDIGKTMIVEKFVRDHPNICNEFVQKLMAYSQELTGRITTLLAQAAELAIREETECISLSLLERAADAGIFKLPVSEPAEEA